MNTVRFVIYDEVSASENTRPDQFSTIVPLGYLQLNFFLDIWTMTLYPLIRFCGVLAEKMYATLVNIKEGLLQQVVQCFRELDPITIERATMNDVNALKF